MQLRENWDCSRERKLSQLYQQPEAVFNILREVGRHTQEQEQGAIKKDHSEDKKERAPKFKNKNHSRSDNSIKEFKNEVEKISQEVK